MLIPLLLTLTLHTTPVSLAERVKLIVDAAAISDSAAAATTPLLPYWEQIESAAQKHRLPASLLAAIIQEESFWDPWATRSEPAYMRNPKVQRNAKLWLRSHSAAPTYATELADRSRSMGLMQVMGETARAQGFGSRFLAELYLPQHAINQGAKLLRSLLDRYRGDTLAAISAYNQGNARKANGTYVNARYVYRVAAAWRTYQTALRNLIIGEN